MLYVVIPIVLFVLSFIVSGRHDGIGRGFHLHTHPGLVRL